MTQAVAGCNPAVTLPQIKLILSGVFAVGRHLFGKKPLPASTRSTSDQNAEARRFRSISQRVVVILKGRRICLPLWLNSAYTQYL